MIRTSQTVNAFTVDVEDYFHVSAFADRISPRQWDTFQSRVVENTHRILRILDERQVQATFFILGWVANRYPRLVRDIHRSGHEIGCHSFWHRLIYDLTPEEFRNDLLQSSKSIADITGERVNAYRAPSFSITEKSLWALDILAAEGYRFDSSIFPIHHDCYGIPNAERFPHTMQTRHGNLCEFPPSVYKIGRYNVPVAGGGYFRLFPFRVTRHLFTKINVRHNQPCMFYIHPWELDPEQPRMVGSFRSRFRHYQNLGSTIQKLKRLLASFSFDCLSRVWSKDKVAVANRAG